MKKLFVSFFAAILFFALTLGISAETLSGTLVRSSAADPWLCTDAEYYYLALTGKTQVAVFRSKTISGFASQYIYDNIVYNSASDRTVEALYGEGATLSGTWSPEIHYFSEEEAPGNSGWYMLLALRNSTGDSSQVKMVVLKSTSGTPKGPYGHPITGELYQSQPVLDTDGNMYADWGIGQSFLVIREGKYKGIYTTWVTEVDRGTADFYQKIMIAKMDTPWQIGSEPAVVTEPTQDWEKKGSGYNGTKYLPKVVEGATALYGTRGDVYITYSGSGYWSDYGLGQLTWTGGDPLKTSSWVKLPDTASDKITLTNPIFTATTADNLRGAGHASFVCDKDGNGFFCYHAYPYTNNTKATARSSYIESYYIDYDAWNGTSYGVIRLGSGVAANTSTEVDFATTGDALGKATVTVSSDSAITLQMDAANAKGYMIYRSTDGKNFSYLTSTESTTYTDSAAEVGKTYYYRVYSYREEEIGEASDVAPVYTLLDVLRILRYVKGDENAVVFSADDRNDDGEIDLGDALLTLAYILNK